MSFHSTGRHRSFCSVARGRAGVIALAAGAAVVATAASVPNVREEASRLGAVPAQDAGLVKAAPHAMAMPNDAQLLQNPTDKPRTPDYSTQLRVSDQTNKVNAARAEQGLRPLFALPAHGEFTSTFAERWGAFHAGVDIAAPIGTPIYSVGDGTVIEAGPASGFGLWVRVRLTDGTVVVYGHVNSIIAQQGQHVMAGDEIATVGNRGNSTGPHLHFEVWKDGKWKIDPLPWLAERGISLGNYVD